MRLSILAAGILLLATCTTGNKGQGLREQGLREQGAGNSLNPSIPAARPPTLAEQLAELPRFEILHSSWPVDEAWLAAENAELAREFARLTGSVGIRLWTGNASSKSWYEGIYARAAALAGQADAVLVMQYSPWHNVGLTGRPDPRLEWRRHIRQLRYLGDACEHLKGWLAERAPDVRVWGILFDSEIYRTAAWTDPAPDDPVRWDQCLAEKLTACDRTWREIWPETEVAWYGARSPRLGVGVLGPAVDYYVPSLYRLYDEALTVGRYWEQWGRANEQWRPGDGEFPRMIACVALGSAYRPGGFTWATEYDYDVECSRKAGTLLRGLPGLRMVYFYPRPGSSKHLEKHLLAYARGWQAARRK